MSVSPTAPVFKISNTLAIKGVAIILMLIHHLFYSGYEDFETLIFNRYIWTDLAKLGKICVPMFIILSGYGWVISCKNKKLSPKTFYIHAYTKLYTGFLPISLLSLVPLLFDFQGKNFTTVWGDNWFVPFIKNFFGLSWLWDSYGYNPTWWFISLILLLYAIFPILYRLVIRFPIIILLVTSICYYIHTSWHPLNLVLYGIFPFVLGMCAAHCKLFEKIKTTKLPCKTLIIVFITAFLACYRILTTFDSGSTLWIDTPLSFSFIVVFWLLMREGCLLEKVLTILGKYSMDIFLMHTFVFSIYFSTFSYYLRYPPLILLQLILVCLVFSIILEKTKFAIKNTFLKLHARRTGKINSISNFPQKEAPSRKGWSFGTTTLKTNDF